MHVSWFDAEAYCNGQASACRRRPNGRRLPEGEDGRIYPWGIEPAGLSRANFGRTGLSGPVRDRPERLLLYPPIVSVDKYENAVSPYGVFQMAGNVAEWTADWYDPKYYKTAPDRNPKGPENGNTEGFSGRGMGRQYAFRAPAQRNGADPKTKMNWLGFRCARDVKDPAETSTTPRTESAIDRACRSGFRVVEGTWLAARRGLAR